MLREKAINIQLLLLLAWAFPVQGQQSDYYLDYPRYSFINYEANKIILPENDSSFRHIFSELDTIIGKGHGKINIVHMGGSHIQADIYTHIVRQRFVELSPDCKGSRGLTFPFKIAKTNNPSHYGVNYTGNWTYCKSTRLAENCKLGLSGITLTTSDSLASISIDLTKKAYPVYSFCRVKVFHESDGYLLSVLTDKDTVYGIFDSLQACSVFEMHADLEALHLQFERLTDSAHLNFMGIYLDSDRPGISYNAVGVNGAKLSSYLRCEYYTQNLAALSPDMVIFSIGTNDAYTRHFDAEKYYQEYKQLLDETLIAAPDAAILLTVPNDSYLYKRYVNRGTAEMRKVILRLASEYKCGVWDFYTVMGGLNSSQAWYSLKLMQYDRIHFTRKGYELKGDLFFSAFLEGWENCREQCQNNKN